MEIAKEVEAVAKKTKKEHNMKLNGKFISVETGLTLGWINKRTGLVTQKYLKEQERIQKNKEKEAEKIAKAKQAKADEKAAKKLKAEQAKEKAEAKAKKEKEEAEAKAQRKLEREAKAKAKKEADERKKAEAKAKREEIRKAKAEAKAKEEADEKAKKAAEKEAKAKARAEKLEAEKAEKEKAKAEKAKARADKQAKLDAEKAERKAKRVAKKAEKEAEAAKKAKILADLQEQARKAGLPIPTRIPRKPIVAQEITALDGTIIKSPYDLERRSGYKTIWQVLAEKHNQVVSNEELHAEVNKRLAEDPESAEWYADKYSSQEDDLGHAKEYPAVKNATDVMTRAPYNGVSKNADGEIVIAPVSLEGLKQRIIVGKTGVMLKTDVDTPYVFNKRAKVNKEEAVTA